MASGAQKLWRIMVALIATLIINYSNSNYALFSIVASNRLKDATRNHTAEDKDLASSSLLKLHPNARSLGTGCSKRSDTLVLKERV